MKCTSLFLFFLIAINAEKIIKTVSVPTIRNSNFPSCRNCIYYQPSFFSTDFDSSTSKCEKIGEKNILTGKITYDYVEICRKDESGCGKKGIYFEEEKNLNMKIFFHKMISSFPETVLISLMVIYIISILRLNH